MESDFLRGGEAYKDQRGAKDCCSVSRVLLVAAGKRGQKMPGDPHDALGEPPDVTIRTCREEDLRQLEWCGIFTPQRRTIERAFESHRRGDGIFLVAEEAGAPVGQVWIDLRKRAEEGIAVLWALRIRPGRMGRGIGTRLVEAAERAAAEAGFQEALIAAERENRMAASLYRRLGYSPAGEVLEPYEHERLDGSKERRTSDLLLFRKPLERGRPEHAP